jgi:hypothetical protein
MPPDSNSSSSFDSSIVDRLACPACLGRLSLLSLQEDRLACAACGRTYPIVDGIPVLIAGLSKESIPSE